MAAVGAVGVGEPGPFTDSLGETSNVADVARSISEPTTEPSWEPQRGLAKTRLNSRTWSTPNSPPASAA